MPGFDTRKMAEKENARLLCRQWLEVAMAQQETALKFSRQVAQLFPEAETDGYQQLVQRMEAAAGYFTRLLESDLLIPMQAHIGELRAKQKTKKYLQEVQALRGNCVRKKQQVEDALRLVRGLQKGVAAATLLSGLQEERKK